MASRSSRTSSLCLADFDYTLGLFIRFGNFRLELKWFRDGKQIDQRSVYDSVA
jgi:hypothetical protein